jgi:tetratricopeptide (TPR) repeat protein
MQILTRACLFIAAALFAAQADAKTASEVFSQAAPSVVVVNSLDAKGKQIGLGSGVVLPGGAVATNCHVIEDAEKFKVRHRHKEYPAKLRHSDWERDVCTLVATGLQAPGIALGGTKALKVGARVYAIGAPEGLELTLSEGIVSSLREVEGGRYIQTTAPISPGSSGGGLFDEEGRLVGLPSFYLTEGQQLNFAVPVEWITELPKRHAAQAKAGERETDWLNRAIALNEKGDWLALQRHSQRWTQVQPGRSLAWFSLGNAYTHSGLRAKAIEAYQQALRINPEDAEVWDGLAFAYRDSGQYTKAIDAFQQALRINPEDAIPWNDLGTAYGRVGQHAKAIEAFQQALRINPESAPTWHNLGKAYMESGKTRNGIEACEQALRIKPDFVLTWRLLGIGYKFDGQNGRVMEVYRRLKALDPKAADEFFNEVVLP